jgi:hypothetical protein
MFRLSVSSAIEINICVTLFTEETGVGSEYICELNKLWHAWYLQRVY